MNIVQKLLLTLALIGTSPLLKALTPQALNKIEALEDTIQNKYAIIDDLNTKASELPVKERVTYKKDGYSLTIESIEKLRTEIADAIKQITTLDKAKGDSKIKDQDKNFKIMNTWIKDGKIGNVETRKVGEKTVEITGISELQHPVLQIIDKLKSLTSADPLYRSEIELLSQSLNRYKKAVSEYKDIINAQYPKIGFATDGIYLGVEKNGSYIFSDLRNQINTMVTKLENEKDPNGVKFIDQKSAWFETKTVGEYIKDQIASIKKDCFPAIDEAIAKIATASLPVTIPPRSPWQYAEDKFFVPFLEFIKNDTDKDVSANINGSFAYINAERTKGDSDGSKSLTDVLLLIDADKAISSYIKENSTFINNKDHKKSFQDFAVMYARITAEALKYTLKLAVGDSTAEANKDFYNNTLLKNVQKLKTAFLTFYNTHKTVLDLDNHAIEFSKDIPDLKDLKTIKPTIDLIINATPAQIP